MENTQIKISFIIPIFDVEKYLRKCIDSILAQNVPLSEYEIILVDDGSPDSCPVICDEYAGTYSNIRVVHRENGGLSAARNSGIEIAQGEYVCFLDGDDFWEENVLSTLIEQIELDNLDVLRFKYQNVRIVTKVKMESESKEQLIYEVFMPYKHDHRLDNDYSNDPVDGITFLNFRMNTGCYVNMFIVKRSLLLSEHDNCLFTHGIYFEDTDWTPRMLIKAKRVASTDTIVYNYLIRQGSISNAIEYDKKRKVLDDKMFLVKSLQKQAADLKLKAIDTSWFGKMIADIVISIIGMLSVDFYSERKKYLKTLKQLSIFPINSSLFKAMIINFSPLLAVEIMHIKNKK